MEYLLRLAKESDCKELSKLKHDVWSETYRGIYPDEKIDNFDYEQNSKKFLNIINNPKIELYVVEYKDKLVGYMSCGALYRPYKDYKQEIGLLYILKEYQRKSMGKKLFNLAYASIKKKGYNEFIICCNKYNTKAQLFYKKMGGKIIHVDDDCIDMSNPQMIFLYQIKADI